MGLPAGRAARATPLRLLPQGQPEWAEAKSAGLLDGILERIRLSRSNILPEDSAVRWIMRFIRSHDERHTLSNG